MKIESEFTREIVKPARVKITLDMDIKEAISLWHITNVCGTASVMDAVEKSSIDEEAIGVLSQRITKYRQSLRNAGLSMIWFKVDTALQQLLPFNEIKEV